VSIWTTEDKVRIADIATTMVVDKAKKGELDLNDDAAVKEALKEAVRVATATYAAALEYVGG